MTKTIKLFTLFLSFFLGLIANAQVDNYEKNKKLNDDEKSRFFAELKTNKDSAQVYWKHANVIAGFTSNASKYAGEFYEKAIKIDPSKVIYFVDYAKYLHEKLNTLDNAVSIYKKGLELFPTNTELNKGQEKLNKEIADKEAQKKMAISNNAPKSRAKAKDYSKITDFDNLAKQTKDKKSEFYYKNLLEKFIADIDLTDEQVYMLLIGFTQEEGYKPYSEEYTIPYELNEEGKYEEAIKASIKLLKTNTISIQIYKELVYAYQKTENKILAESYLKKIQAILYAMLYTGDGSCEKPYVTFTVKDEYTLLKYLNYERAGSVGVVTCAGQMADKMSATNLTTKENNVIYFNIMALYKKMMGK